MQFGEVSFIVGKARERLIACTPERASRFLYEGSGDQHH